MKIFVTGTETGYDDKIFDVDVHPDDHQLVELDNRAIEPRGTEWVAPTGELHWIGNTPIAVWGPAL